MFYKPGAERIFPNTAMHRILADGNDKNPIQSRRLKRRIAPYVDKLGRCATSQQGEGATEQSSNDERSESFHSGAFFANS
jgi:hypothetical protein